MVFHFHKKRSVERNLRKVAGDQIDKAIEEVENEQLDLHETVHQIRKRCKKVRGLIRLVRGAFDGYDCENSFFRDAARPLSPVRDAQSMISCLEGLAAHYRDQTDGGQFEVVRRHLAERRQRLASDRFCVERRLDEFRTRMREARHRVLAWELQEKGYSAIGRGLRKTYGRGRAALRQAYRNPSAETYHEWRKRVKYHWYHTRLLRDVWPDMLAVHMDAADALSDMLGDQHDLSVLRATLVSEPSAWGAETDVRAVVSLVDRRWQELQAAARPLGERLFAETPKRLSKRFQRYWNIWRE
jgi:CHAD domain-containing protein